MRSRAHGKSSIGVVDSLLYMVKVLLSILIEASRGHRMTEDHP